MGSLTLVNHAGNGIKSIGGHAATQLDTLGGNQLIACRAAGTDSYRKYYCDFVDGVQGRIALTNTGYDVNCIAVDHNLREDFQRIDGRSFFTADKSSTRWNLYQRSVEDFSILRQLAGVRMTSTLATPTAMTFDGVFLWVLWDDGSIEIDPL